MLQNEESGSSRIAHAHRVSRPRLCSSRVKRSLLREAVWGHPCTLFLFSLLFLWEGGAGQAVLEGAHPGDEQREWRGWSSLAGLAVLGHQRVQSFNPTLATASCGQWEAPKVEQQIPVFLFNFLCGSTPILFLTSSQPHGTPCCSSNHSSSLKPPPPTITFPHLIHMPSPGPHRHLV